MVKKIFQIFISIMLLVFFVALFNYENIFIFFIKKKLANIESEYGATLSVDSIAVNGISKVEFSNVNIAFNNTKAYIDSIKLEIEPTGLSMDSIFKNISINHILISFEKVGKKKNKHNSHSQHNYNKRRFDNLKLNLFKKVSITEITINKEGTSHTLYNCIYQNNKFNTSYSSLLMNKKQSLNIHGVIKEDNSTRIELNIIPIINTPMRYARSKDTLSLKFNQVSITLQASKLIDSCYTVDSKIHGLCIEHPYISKNSIYLDSLSSRCNIKFTNERIVIDSTSKCYINKLAFSPQITINRGKRAITSKIHVDKIECDKVISELPNGILNSLVGYRFEGNIALDINCKIDLNSPDSSYLEAETYPENIKITKKGKTDLYMMNGSFKHKIYTGNQKNRTIMIGNENSAHISLQEIPQNLVQSILNAEDGLFFKHKGFISEAFTRALIDNIKRKRFARGGSTISMQLVKNVFLSKEKNLCRKFEEIVLTWLIENLHITTKERMLEVYCNIIEWGPGIYGVTEASKFYFDKKPQDLTLKECIFLTYIIPRPRKFYSSFSKEGKTSLFYKQYHHRMLDFLCRSKYLTPEDTIDIAPIERLQGEAWRYVIQPEKEHSEMSLPDNPNQTTQKVY